MKKAVLGTLGVMTLGLTGCGNSITNGDIQGAINEDVTPVEETFTEDIEAGEYCNQTVETVEQYIELQEEQTEIIEAEEDMDRALEVFTEQQQTIGLFNEATAPYVITDDDELNEANEAVTESTENMLNAYLEAKDDDDAIELIDTAGEEWTQTAQMVGAYCLEQQGFQMYDEELDNQ